MSAPPPSPLYPPMQRPPAESTVSSPPLPINSSSLPKSPPSLASSSSSALASASTSASASDLCVYTPYVAVAVPLIPVLAVIVIAHPPCNYCHRPRPFLSLVTSSVTCVHFVPEATERLVQQETTWLENSRPSELVRKVDSAVLLLVLVRMYPLCTGEFKNYEFS